MKPCLPLALLFVLQSASAFVPAATTPAASTPAASTPAASTYTTTTPAAPASVQVSEGLLSHLGASRPGGGGGGGERGEGITSSNEPRTPPRLQLFPSWTKYYNLFGELARLYGAEDLIGQGTGQIVSTTRHKGATGWEGALREERRAKKKKRRRKKKKREEGLKGNASLAEIYSKENVEQVSVPDTVTAAPSVGTEISNGTRKTKSRWKRRRRRRKKLKSPTSKGQKVTDLVLGNNSYAFESTAPRLIPYAGSAPVFEWRIPASTAPSAQVGLESASAEEVLVESTPQPPDAEEGAGGGYIVPERLRLRDDMTPHELVEQVNRDFDDVVLEDKQEMAQLGREDAAEDRELAEEDAAEERDIDGDEWESFTATTEAPPDEVEEYVSEHENPPEPPTRPNYTHEGMWARPPPDLGIDFIPLQTFTQVRRYETVRHLSPEDALAEATTEEEYVNAPRLREVVSHRKTTEVYSEEGYEDAGYDHGGYNKEGEHHEVIPSYEATAMMVKMPEAEGDTREEYVLDPNSEGSQHHAKRVRPDGKGVLNSSDFPRNRTRHGNEKTTKGSWSISQVIKDNNDKVVVFNEGGNITSPTTLRPMSASTRVNPSTRYAAKHENGTYIPADATKKRIQSPTTATNSNNTNNLQSSKSQPKYQRNIHKPEFQKVVKRPPPKRKKEKKKVSKIPSQLLGFKYPAVRKKVKSKGEKNSPLAKAKRKRKMKERVKKRKKLLKAQAQEKKIRQKTTNKIKDDLNLSSNASPKSAIKKYMSNKNTSEELVDASKRKTSPAYDIHNNHRYDKTIDPAFFSLKLMETIRKKQMQDSLFQKLIPSKTPTSKFKEGQPWTSHNDIDSVLTPQNSLPESWNNPWNSFGNNHLSQAQSTEITVTDAHKQQTEAKDQTSGFQVPGSRHTLFDDKSIDTVKSKLYPEESGTKWQSKVSGNNWGNSHGDWPGLYAPYNSWGSTKPSSVFTEDQTREASNVNNLYENVFTPIKRRIDMLHDSIMGDGKLMGTSKNEKLHKLHRRERSTSTTYNLGGDIGQSTVQSTPPGPSRFVFPVTISKPTDKKHVYPEKILFKKTLSKHLSNPEVRRTMDLQRKRYMTQPLNSTDHNTLRDTNPEVRDVTHKSGTENHILASITTEILPSLNITTDKKDIQTITTDTNKTTNANASSTKEYLKPKLTSGENELTVVTVTSTPSSTNRDPGRLHDDTDEETTEIPEFDESDPSWIHDQNTEATKTRHRFKNPPVNKRKYPFYRAPKSEKLTSYTPLRYASNPYDVPIKSEGGMEFYESRDRMVHCEEPRKPEKVVPERAEDGEWNEKPQPDGPRLGTLGDVIGCMRMKLFGENPLDNPFFQETSVGLPQDTAMVGALVDAVGTPAPKLFDQYGFYKDILANIRSTSVDRNPVDDTIIPFIRVGADAFDSDEAPSSPGNVRVAYALPKDWTQTIHSTRKQVEPHNSKIAWKDIEVNKVNPPKGSNTKSSTNIKLENELQDSAEDSFHNFSPKKQLKDSDRYGSESTSVEYYVDKEGRPLAFQTGGKLEKSNKSKQGRKKVIYHNIVRPFSREILHDTNAQRNLAEGSNTKTRKELQSMTPQTRKYNNLMSKLKSSNMNEGKQTSELRNTYHKALQNSKALTNAKNEKLRNKMKVVSAESLPPPISKSVLSSLESSELPLEDFLNEPNHKKIKNKQLNFSKLNIRGKKKTDVEALEALRDPPAQLKKSPDASDSEEDVYDIESSESSDFVRPKGNKTEGSTSFMDSKKKGGSNEFRHTKSFVYASPLEEEDYEGEDYDDDFEKGVDAASKDQIQPKAIAAETRSSESEGNRVRSIHLGMEEDSVIEIPLDSTQISPIEDTTQKRKDSKQNKNGIKKSASTESTESKTQDSKKTEEINPDSEETEKNEETADEGVTDQTVTFEEFKKTLTPEELTFFTDEDDDEDELSLYDDYFADKKYEKPERKKVKASKIVEIVQKPDGEDDDTSKQNGDKAQGIDKNIVKVVANFENNIKPETNVKVVKTSDEIIPEFDEEYDDYGDLDDKTTQPKSDKGNKLESSESKATSQEQLKEDSSNMKDDDSEDADNESADANDDDDEYVDDEDEAQDEEDVDENQTSKSDDTVPKKENKVKSEESNVDKRTSRGQSQQGHAQTKKGKEHDEKESNGKEERKKDDKEASDGTQDSNGEDEEDEDDEGNGDEAKKSPEAASSNEGEVKSEISPFRTAEQEVSGKGVAESEFEKLSKPIEVEILGSDSSPASLNVSTSTTVLLNKTNGTAENAKQLLSLDTSDIAGLPNTQVKNETVSKEIVAQVLFPKSSLVQENADSLSSNLMSQLHQNDKSHPDAVTSIISTLRPPTSAMPINNADMTGRAPPTTTLPTLTVEQWVRATQRSEFGSSLSSTAAHADIQALNDRRESNIMHIPHNFPL